MSLFFVFFPASPSWFCSGGSATRLPVAEPRYLSATLIIPKKRIILVCVGLGTIWTYTQDVSEFTIQELRWAVGDEKDSARGSQKEHKGFIASPQPAAHAAGSSSCMEKFQEAISSTVKTPWDGKRSQIALACLSALYMLYGQEEKGCHHTSLSDQWGASSGVERFEIFHSSYLWLLLIGTTQNHRSLLGLWFHCWHPIVACLRWCQPQTDAQMGGWSLLYLERGAHSLPNKEGWQVPFFSRSGSSF